MNELVELDQLLYGECTFEQVVAFFKDGEFCEESYSIEAIKRYLRTDEDKKMLNKHDLTISDCLNCRIDEEQEKDVFPMYDRWNKKLGFEHFG